MLKLANQVLDAYDDVCRDGLRKVARLNPQITMMSPDEHAKLQDHNFALCMITKRASKLNKFPIDSADNTWLSNQFFDVNSHKLPKTASLIAGWHIKRACEKFKIQATSSVTAAAALVKEAADSNICYESEELRPTSKMTVARDFEKLANVQGIADNPTTAQYAMPNTGMVKAAGEYFTQHYEKMPLETRHKYAAAIQTRAAELGMPPQGGTVVKYASNAYSAQLDAHISSRASLLDSINPQAKATLEKMAGMKDKATPVEFAQALHSFDKKAGLTRYYNSYLTDPFQATLGPAMAHAPKLSKLASGNELRPDELAMVVNSKYDEIKSHFGPHLAEELKKDPTSIFESLPNDAKEIIVNIANGTM